MKILIVNHHPQDVIGGSEIQSDLIATQLSRLGHHVVYFAVQGQQQQYNADYEVEPGSFENGGLHRILVKHQPDLVYWRFNRRKLLSAVLTCKRLKVKVVFAVSSGSDLMKWSHRSKSYECSFAEKIQTIYPFLRHIISTRIHYFGYYFVDGVIAQLAQQTHTLPIRREVVIPNSVDDGVIPFCWNKPFIVWIGTFKSVKNPQMYIKLARHFQHTGIDFLMVGKIRADYERLLQYSSIPSNLYCLGVRPNHEVNGILQQSLFLVQTSDIEGFPNVLIQAWAQGKPTVGLYYDPDNMIRDHNLGYISGSFEQLIQDTRTLIDNETLRKEMGQRAKIFAKTHFNPEQNIRKFEAFFREICETE